MRATADGAHPRILHAAAMLRPSPGIVSQMLDEERAARELGLPWSARVFAPTGATGPAEIMIDADAPGASAADTLAARALAWFRLRSAFYQWLRVQSGSHDCLVLRYNVHDPLQWSFTRSVRTPVVFVHHTLEVPELQGAGWIGRGRAIGDRILGGATLARAHGVVGVTDEILRYEVARSGRRPSFEHVYPNGILPGEWHDNDERGREPEFLFVASRFEEWHGLDMLLEQVASSSERFKLHLVGELSPAQAVVARSDQRVESHGRLCGSRIRDLVRRSWVGLSSFALHRNGMTSACTLKVREYLARGLPVFAGHRDVFPDDFEFFRSGRPEWPAMLEYAHHVRRVRREDVATAAAPFIDKRGLLANFYAGIAESLGGIRESDRRQTK